MRSLRRNLMLGIGAVTTVMFLCAAGRDFRPGARLARKGI